jgi:hypothetical protein
MSLRTECRVASQHRQVQCVGRIFSMGVRSELYPYLSVCHDTVVEHWYCNDYIAHRSSVAESYVNSCASDVAQPPTHGERQ